jgi:hypothetical protein
MNRITEFDHPEHCWKWTPLEIEFLNKKFAALAAEVDNLQAKLDMCEDFAARYEELRAAIDGGSESMTHKDALEQIKYWRERCNIITDPAAIRAVFEDDDK